MKTLSRQEEQILLVIFHLKDNAYLVSVRDKLKEITGKYLDVGTIYVPLKRLDEAGYLQSYLGEPTSVRGGKRIKYYRLTELARQSLSELKNVQEKLWDGFVFQS